MKQERTHREKLLRSVAEGHSSHEAVYSALRPGAGMSEYEARHKELTALSSGIGTELWPFVQQAHTTDVLVLEGHVWVDRGRGVEDQGRIFSDENHVRATAVRMAAACGRRLDEASPVVDGTLSDGTRLHAVLPPIAAGGTLISLRIPSKKHVRIKELNENGSIHSQLMPLLAAFVEKRANVVISGATGSGKTTLLGAILGEVPLNQRIMCIEEVSELQPKHPHIVRVQERQPNIQGAGAVTLSDLVRAAMRMRPDRLVLGECRGREILDVLTALNTGHDGGWVTLHANSVVDVPARLCALGALAGMGSDAIRAQTIAALDAVIHMQRLPVRQENGVSSRYLSAVGVFDTRNGELVCEPALTVEHPEESSRVDLGQVIPGPGYDRLAQCWGFVLR